MTKRDKIIEKILSEKTISFEEARNLLTHLGFEERSRGSHHSFRKLGNRMTVTLTSKRELKKYQLKILQEVLQDHGY